jgi:hypothetical protein
MIGIGLPHGLSMQDFNRYGTEKLSRGTFFAKRLPAAPDSPSSS